MKQYHCLSLCVGGLCVEGGLLERRALVVV